MLTLLLRPSAWLILIGVLGFSSFALMLGSNKLSRSLIRPKVVTHASIEQMALLESASTDQAVGVRYERVLIDHWSNRSDAGLRLDDVREMVLDRLAALKRLEGLTFGRQSVDAEMLDRVAGFVSLKALQLPDEDLVAREVADQRDDLLMDLSPLARLQALEMLDLGGRLDAKISLRPLAALPNLRSLAFNSPDLITAEHLREIAALPALEVLYLPEIYSYAEMMRHLPELQASPNLRVVYLSVRGRAGSKWLGEARKAMGGLTVRRGDYSDFVGMIMICPLAAGAMVGMFGQHVVGWFSGAAAMVLPGYRRPHRLITWVVMLAGLAVVIVPLAWATGAVVPAVAWVLMSSMTSVRGYLWSGMRVRGLRRLMGLSVWFGYALLFALALIPMLTPWAQAFLFGDYPVVAWAVIGWVMVLVFDADQSVLSLCRRRVAHNLPHLMSMNDFRQEVEARSLQQADAPPVGWWPGGSERKNQWRGWVIFVGTMLLITMPMLLPWIRGKGSGGINTDALSATVLINVSMFLMIPVSMISVIWWQRFPMLGGLLTRPPGRQEQCRLFFKAMGKSFAKLWVFPLLAGGIMSWRDGWEMGIAGVVLGVGLIAMIYAVTLMVLPIRRGWLAFLALWAILTGVVGLGGGMGYLISTYVVVWPFLLGAGLGLWGLAAWMVLGLAPRQYARIQWGLY